MFFKSKTNFFYSFIFEHYDCIIIVLLGFIPLAWVEKGCLLASGDFSGLLDPITYSSFYLFPWIRSGLGNPNFYSCISVSYNLFFCFLQFLGCSPILSQRIWISFFFVLTGLSMRYFIKTIMDGKKAQIWALVSGVFYMINFYVINCKSYLLNINGFYACMPLILAFVYRIIVLRREQVKYSVIIALTSLLFVSGAVNPPNMIMFVSIIGLFVFYAFLMVKMTMIDYLRIMCCVAIVWVLFLCMNYWWIMPYIQLMFHYKGVESFQPIYWNPGSWLKNSLILGGSWAWGDYYYPISYPVYKNIFVTYALYLVPFMAFGSLLFQSLNKKVCYFFAFISLVGVFFAKGRNGLFGNIYLYLFDHFSGFWMFREPYTKFSVLTALGYAVLIGAFAQHGFEKLKNISAQASVGFICVTMSAIVLAGWPIFTRYYVDQVDAGTMSASVRVPNYWKEFSSFINVQKDEYRLFEMPENKSCYTVLDWNNGFCAANPELCFIKKPAVTSSTYAPSIIQYYYYMMRDYSCRMTSRLFNLFNVKYVYQRNDFMWTMVNSFPPKHVLLLLQKKLKLQKDKSFGSIDLYRAGGEQNLVYLKNSVDMVVGGFRTLPVLSYTDFMDSPCLYFWGQPASGEIKNVLRHTNTYIFYEEAQDEWIMSMFPDSFRVHPEALIGWNNYDYKKGWSIRNNFYRGEWVDENEQQYVDGDFLESGGAAFTRGTVPINFAWEFPCDDNYWIGLRILSSTEKNGIQFKIDDDSSLEWDTFSEREPHYKWLMVSKKIYRGLHKLTIRNQGARAIIDSIIFFTDKQKETIVQQAEELLQGKDVVLLFAWQVRKSVRKEFRVLSEGMYDISFCSYEKLIAPQTKVALYVDKNCYDIEPKTQQFVSLGKIQLSKGMHTLESGENSGDGVIKVSNNVFEEKSDNRKIAASWSGSSRVILEAMKIERPSILVFNEKYHDGWKAYITKCVPAYRQGLMALGNVFIKRRDYEKINEHFLINGYANAFYLPKPGTYNILIEFDPQNEYDRGLLFAVAAYLFSACYLGYKYLKS